ncbi:uncharacterized protein LOC126687917 [Mercurialis annua]|uniref:uncharacterized protein LOC126687917 n=1 Tax=Mercurialis annua TaxID=3986 RepID=UPI00215E2A77|nr:uncharacterized protein LOC126687917 [Mercurialis annua]
MGQLFPAFSRKLLPFSPKSSLLSLFFCCIGTNGLIILPPACITISVRPFSFYQYHFYKHSWGVIKGDIIKAVQEAFQNGKILKNINSTSVVVIPKSPNAENLGDFRPIACCNVIYKIITKILSSRLSPILCNIVSENRSAFVPKRSIAHNIMLAHDLTRNYHRDVGSPRCIIKIDLKKAYDSLSWDFIEEILISLDFPDSFILLVMNCIKTASFSINWKGRAGEIFHSSQGLRQGDPMSLLLFVLSMEYLSRMLNDVSNDFCFHKSCKKLKINHLMFADDLLLFCHGDIKSVQFLSDSLNSFKNTSGLSVNPSKSQIFFCNINSELKNRILNMLGFIEGELPLRYLGIPLITSRLSHQDCKGIIEKITKRISSWTSKLLSYAGRVQLIQYVLMSMHVFWASIMLLPKKVNKEIQSICARFLWNGNQEGKYSALVAWKDIIKQKKEGGLGIKDIGTWNKAAISKHVWQVMSGCSSLWVKWIHQNKLKNCSFWGIKANNDSNWIWRGLLSIRSDIRKMVSYSIGDGKLVNFWNDPWLQGCSLLEKFPRVKMKDANVSKTSCVADLWKNNRWNLPDPIESNTEEAWSFIKENYKLRNTPDLVRWNMVKSHRFSISYTWNEMREQFDQVSWHRLIWNKHSVPRFSFLLWLAMRRKMRTKDRLFKWKVVEDEVCIFCNHDAETIDHCLFECEYVKKIWDKLLPICSCPGNILTWRRLISWFSNRAVGKNAAAAMRRIILSATVYYDWRARNKKIFANENPDSAAIINNVRNVVLAKLSTDNVNSPIYNALCMLQRVDA